MANVLGDFRWLIDSFNRRLLEDIYHGRDSAELKDEFAVYGVLFSHDGRDAVVNVNVEWSRS